MEFCEEICRQMTVVNKVLGEMGIHPLLENSDFRLNELSFENYVSLSYRRPDKIGFDINFGIEGFEFNVDRAMEAFYIGVEELSVAHRELRDFLFKIYKSRIVVEYCGDNYTKISFLDKDNGDCIDTLRFISGFYLKVNCKSTEYSPIVE